MIWYSNVHSIQTYVFVRRLIDTGKRNLEDRVFKYSNAIDFLVFEILSLFTPSRIFRRTDVIIQMALVIHLYV